ESYRPEAGAPVLRRSSKIENPFLRFTPLRQARNYRLGSSDVPLWCLRRRLLRKTSVRPVLRQELFAAIGPVDPAQDLAGCDCRRRPMTGELPLSGFSFVEKEIFAMRRLTGA